MSQFVTKTLDNGLTVVLKETHTAPVISWWLMYRIGSRNEPTGKTGISHWVEHMMFKGTDRFPAGMLDREIDRSGGQWNAFTSMDYTMYYETMPSGRIDIALQAEADRMVNSLFDPEETESERTVIISERQGAENRPLFWLSEEVRAAAFRVHGYHHEIIGDMTDLYTMTRDDLYNHYRRHYLPNNAVAVAVGHFDTDDMLARVDELYGKIPSGPKPDLFVRPEPDQAGERRVNVERPGHTAFLEIVYRIPPANEQDWFVLEILDSVLTGPSGVADNKTSRLYKSMVETEIAASINGDLTATLDPYLYSVVVTLRDGRTHEEAEAIILDELARVHQEGITEAELKKAKKQARASFAYSTESVTEQAYWLARSAVFNDFNWFDDYISKLEAVTLDDVQRVVQQYLTSRNRTVGWLIPTGLEDDGEV